MAIVLRPNAQVSDDFEPAGHFLVMCNGTMTGQIRAWGIAKEIYDDPHITDKTSYWTELDPTVFLTNADKTAGWRCFGGVVVQLRADNADNARFVSWGIDGELDIPIGLFN